MAASEFSIVAPAGLQVPADLRDFVQKQERESFVLDHGLTPAQVRPGWWHSEGIQLRFPTVDPEGSRLTRANLFHLGTKAETDAEVLDFVWHVLAWGGGSSRRHMRGRIEHIPENLPLIRCAMDAAKVGRVRDAYRMLIRRGGGVIRHLGPSFFTKVLYFASPIDDPKLFILDERVATAMNAAGWRMSETQSHWYNWYTDTYTSYCETLSNWAADLGGGFRGDMFEKALFDRG